MTLLLVSNGVLLVVVVAMAVVALALARQVGVIHERTAPAGLVRAAAIAPGSRLPVTTVPAADGSLIELPRDRPLALLFVGVRCPVCHTVLPAFREYLRAADPPREGFWVVDQLDDVEAFCSREGLPADRVLVSVDVALALQVHRLPTLALLEAGLVVGRIQALDGAAAMNEVARPRAASFESEVST